MAYDTLREQVTKELARIKAMVILAENYDDWHSIGNKLCNLDTEIDKVINPYNYENSEDY